MNHPRQFIRAVLVVFWLLILTRMIVELGFFTWGVLILRNDVRKGSATHA